MHNKIAKVHRSVKDLSKAGIPWSVTMYAKPESEDYTISCLVIPWGIRNEMRISEPTNQRGHFLENSDLDQAKSHKFTDLNTTFM